MADVVIVVGTRRGNEKVPTVEIRQMVGRAGRRHGGEACLAYVICDDEDIDEVLAEVGRGENQEIRSSFLSADNVVFHLMPEICSGKVMDVESADRWFSRTLASRQGAKVDFSMLFGKMEKMGAVCLHRGVARATKCGEIAASLYFHPADVQAWKENFGQVFDLGLEMDTAAIAWALGTLHHSRSHGDFGKHRFVIEDFKSALPLGLDIRAGTLTQTILWWAAMGGPSVGKMRNQLLELRGDIGRIKRALVLLDEGDAHWDRTDFFEDVEMMARKGIGFHLLDLCRLPGITKGRADYLYNKGAHDLEGIREIMDEVEDEVDERFMSTLRGAVNGVSGSGS